MYLRKHAKFEKAQLTGGSHTGYEVSQKVVHVDKTIDHAVISGSVIYEVCGALTSIG